MYTIKEAPVYVVRLWFMQTFSQTVISGLSTACVDPACQVRVSKLAGEYVKMLHMHVCR